MGKPFFTFYDVAMISDGFGVSRYPQYYDQHLEKYQFLPRPYLGSFEGHNEEKW